MGVQIVAKTIQVEFQPARVLKKIRRLQGMLVLEKKPVHLPEFSLRRGGLRGLGGEARVRMQLHQGKIPKRVANLPAEPVEQRANDGFRSRAVGTFVVTVLDERQRRIWRPECVISIAEWLLQNLQGGIGSKRHGIRV